jgi:hypothetical protein
VGNISIGGGGRSIAYFGGDVKMFLSNFHRLSMSNKEIVMKTFYRLTVSVVENIVIVTAPIPRAIRNDNVFDFLFIG